MTDEMIMRLIFSWRAVPGLNAYETINNGREENLKHDGYKDVNILEVWINDAIAYRQCDWGMMEPSLNNLD